MNSIWNKIIQMNKYLRWILIAVTCIILILILIFAVLFQNYEIIGQSFNCTTNAPIDVDFYCKLDKINETTQYWSFEGNIPEGFVVPNLMGRVSAYRIDNGELIPTSISNITTNVCKHSGGRLSRMFMSTFLPDMLAKGNLDRPCPFSGTVYLRNFQFRTITLPRITPGEYLLDFAFFAQGFEEISFNIQIYVIVKRIPWKWWF